MTPENAPAGMSFRPRLLFLAHLLPWPLDGGGQIKSYHTLRILATRFDITLLAFVRRDEESANREALAPLCAGGVHTVKLPRGKVHDLRTAAIALLLGQSFLMRRDAADAMRIRVNTILAEAESLGAPFAVLHVDHLQMASFVPPAGSGPKVVLDEHNVEYRIPQRLGEAPDASPPMRSFARREWPRLRDFERDACRRADRVLAVSAEDAAALTALDPAALRERVVPVPIGVDLEHWEAVTPEADADEILSIGTMYWPPNVDALLYFCAEVLPLVRARLPRVRLNIVGSRPTAAVRALGAADPLVTVTGWVDDVRAYARRGGVFVAPLRSGSGMRVKILNAMAMGLPVVSTTVGAEGIAVTQGEDILLADTPSAFAAAVVELLTDRARAARMGNAGRRLMERHYGWEAVGRQLLEAYDPLLPAAAQREGARR